MGSKTLQYGFISLFAGLLCLVVWWLLPAPRLECGVIEPPMPVCGNSFGMDDGKGAKLFKSNCASCHKMEGKLIGPPLLGVLERWEATDTFQGISGRDWLKRYIRNWQDPVGAGHPYATQIITYDASAMTHFTHLTDADLEAILMYLQ